MNRFWMILAVVIIGIIAVAVATKPKTDTSSFSGDITKIQADDHTKGNPEAKVTLIEYGDFQCPSCGSVYSIVKDLEETYSKNVKFVFRHFPLITIHPNAFSASRAAEAASRQGKFWEMHDQLFETQNAWGQITTNQQSTFEGYAKELGLNIEQFKKDFVSEDVASRINRDVSSAQKLGATGTPTFLLNGKKIETPSSKEQFEKLLKDAITEANKPK